MIKNLTYDDFLLFEQLKELLRKKSVRNKIRQKYYDGKIELKDLGISIPPQLRRVETVVGWPAKAVDALASRSLFDGFINKDGTQNEILTRILADNQFKVLYRQAVTSQLINSVAFFTVSKGQQDEPTTLISSYSAHDAAAIWDGRKKRIKSGLTVAERDEQGNATTYYLYTDQAVIEITHDVAYYYPHKQGRPLIEAIRYAPTIDRPFGKSRISRAVMSITDSAVRAALRTEVAAEFFTTPQKYLLGADEAIFDELSKWEAYTGSIFAVTKDEDGNTPQFGQLTQMSMQPHIDYMRSLASRFAGETGIPVSSLGVIHDNPVSAEAIYAAKEDLVIEANTLNQTNAVALKNIALLALAAEKNTTIDLLDEQDVSIQAKFKDASMPSIVSQSDAMIKQASIVPWLGETEVALEMLGYTDDQITRLMAQKRTISAMQALSGLYGNKPTGLIANGGTDDDASTINA